MVENEKKWQEFWEKHPELYRANDFVGTDRSVCSKKAQTQGSVRTDKKYILVEFPYPSGSGLHVGHAFSFTGADVYARFKRMSGFNVMFPMGWDAFGLPTENYAIKTKQPPQKVTKDNTDKFKSQMKQLAFSFDWSREVNTTDPKYYKWTQWIFIQLFKAGLAYKKKMPINWCPSCKIGLANEEVVNSRCERCGTEVSRRNIDQWVVKITDYADKLIEGLDKTAFIEKVKQAQIKWIGKSEGANVKFKIVGAIHESPLQHLEIFTTRPDTMFGATFMVVAPEHELVDEILNNNVGAIHESPLQKIKNYVENVRKKSDLERTELTKGKTGVFSGLYVLNPATGKEIPIWISDFVLPNYGTGAIMGVPAHDDRDKEFAEKFGLEIISVYDDEEKIINSDFLNGMKPADAIKKMIDWLQEKEIGEAKSSYHLRDWIFSRQHYWGEPIPMVYCEKCNWQPVPETELPIKLPEVENYEPTDNGESPLSLIPGWVDTVCPICREPAKRETDTMPNWAGSDWYFLRYIDPFNEKTFADFEKMKYWMPVDVYIGGDEHNTLHLLYSRFIYKFLYDLGKVPVDEPYFKRLSHGVILGPDGQRMSKSKGNVIVPEVVAEKYGVDVVRMYLMFIGPFDGTMAWNENTLMGVKRFLDRFELFIKGQINNQSSNETVSSQNAEVIINKLIKGVTEDIDSFKFNTAIAKSMEALNSLTALKENINLKSIQTLIKLIAPFAPYTAEELYSQLEKSDENYGSVHVSEWPKIDEKYLKEEKVTIAVAINGKVRGQIELDTDRQEEKEEILKMAKENDRVKPWLEGKIINKEIYVPGKMINFLIS
ncbi:MAG: leucine--tRNA ligase [Candidatus Shapirobacteria bacterium]|nr:leucine--tRNA ligase [Candidatus Shapirobacteria bacterium]